MRRRRGAKRQCDCEKERAAWAVLRREDADAAALPNQVNMVE
jgi:hypothetical protein